jgi:starch-binding outer membrane protein, SusD/RagB family
MKESMKKIKYSILVFVAMAFSQGCSDFLEREPLGVQTEEVFYNDPENAVLAINAIYDAAAWDEGGKNSGHNYEWMWGDMLSDDSKKGSTPGDYVALKELEQWRIQTSFGESSSLWNNSFAGIFRANQAILNLEKATFDEGLKNRLLGEAHFLRAYFYFNLVIKFGGLPLMTEPLAPSNWGSLQRSSIGEIYAQIDTDLDRAASLLPEKAEYAPDDKGRATRGAALAYKARAVMYQIGTVNAAGHTWQDVLNLTNQVINSGQYKLAPNYATIFENEGENNSESIFEIQFVENTGGYGPIKTGTTNNIIQSNRSTWGWGFNNPTQDLIDEFEDLDPRLECTVYGDGDIVQGEVQVVDGTQNETGYLNRKAAVEPGLRPNDGKDAPSNIRKFRYSDILLMNAEAAFHTGNESLARQRVNEVRERARLSTHAKGITEGSLAYEPYTSDEIESRLPAIVATGNSLLEAIYHERRVELAMEGLRYYDLVRTGRYFDALEEKYGSTVVADCLARSIQDGTVNPIPVMPIPLNESQSWNLQQNPGY